MPCRVCNRECIGSYCSTNCEGVGRATRLRIRKQGLCIICKIIPKDGYKYCTSCKKDVENTANRERLRKVRKETAITCPDCKIRTTNAEKCVVCCQKKPCIKCNVAPRDGYKYCTPCSDLVAKEHKISQRKKPTPCIECNVAPKDGYKYCKECSVKMAKVKEKVNRKRIRAAKKTACEICHTVVCSGKYCRDCSERLSDHTIIGKRGKAFTTKKIAQKFLVRGTISTTGSQLHVS